MTGQGAVFQARGLAGVPRRRWHELVLVMLAFAALAFSMPGLGPASAQAQENRGGTEGAPAGKFDYYVLALSWSPTFCASEAGQKSPLQCAQGRPYGFVVHGLWPQFEKDSWPESCPSKFEGFVPEDLVRQQLDIMPSKRLVGYQWRKHGVCSGLSPEAYFSLIRRAAGKMKVPQDYVRPTIPRRVSPAAVEAGLISVNPGLKADGVAVQCSGSDLSEVRVCLTKDLAFRSCPPVDRRSCRRDAVTMPAVR